MKSSPVERIKTSRKGAKYKTEDTFFLTFYPDLSTESVIPMTLRRLRRRKRSPGPLTTSSKSSINFCVEGSVAVIPTSSALQEKLLTCAGRVLIPGASLTK
jgi:hypothetical protein